MALHHLTTDDDKKAFYGKIYDNLNPNGVFYNADLVIASGEALQEKYMNKWKAFMNRNISGEEIDNKWMPKYYEEDKPAGLVDQLQWLLEIGFKDVDVLWKYYNFAVYGGVRRAIS